MTASSVTLPPELRQRLVSLRRAIHGDPELAFEEHRTAGRLEAALVHPEWTMDAEGMVTVPRGAPAPGLFQISLRFLDNEYNPVRYQWVGTQLYSNGYPRPPRAGRGQGQGQQGQGQQGR